MGNSCKGIADGTVHMNTLAATQATKEVSPQQVKGSEARAQLIAEEASLGET